MGLSVSETWGLISDLNLLCVGSKSGLLPLEAAIQPSDAVFQAPGAAIQAPGAAIQASGAAIYSTFGCSLADQRCGTQPSISRRTKTEMLKHMKSNPAASWPVLRMIGSWLPRTLAAAISGNVQGLKDRLSDQLTQLIASYTRYSGVLREASPLARLPLS